MNKIKIHLKEIKKDTKLCFECNEDININDIDFRDEESARKTFLDVFSDKLISKQ